MKEKQIYVFICEDQETAKKLVHHYFKEGLITYAEMFDDEKRERIVKALELV